VNREHIVEIFSVYGIVKSVEMLLDRNHPEFSKGYAYVDYELPDDAEKAVMHMNGGLYAQLYDLTICTIV